MRHYVDVAMIQGANGALTPAHGAGIQVNDATTLLPATIYSDDGITPKANPTFADSLGRFDFFVADGRYNLIVSGAGFVTFTLSGVEIADVTEESTTDAKWEANTIKVGNFNNILYVDGITYTSLANAVAACGSTCWIIDTLPETFNTDPFAALAGFAHVTFGVGQWTLNAQVTLPATLSLIEGRGRPGIGNTTFVAGASFPISTAMFRAFGTQGQLFRQMAVNCNGVAGSTGILASDWNENSGIEKLLVTNCATTGVTVDATAFASIPAQNYFIRDLEVFPGTAGGASTIGLLLKGNGGGGPGDVRNVTASGQAGHVIRSSVQATNWQQGALFDIHGEFATNVFESLAATPISNFTLDQANGTSTDTNVVNLGGATSNGFILRNIGLGGGTNTIVDSARSTTLTDSVVTLYQVGPGAVGSEDIYTTSPTVTKVLNSKFQQLPTAFASLGTPANGTFTYCNDCTIANPCAGGGTGAFAKRLNGVWVCS